MVAIIISALSFIAAITSLICVIIMNIIVGCYMKQADEYEAEIERLQAALENAVSKEK